MITPTSWEDLGFRRLGPVIPGDLNGQAQARSLAATLQNMIGYEKMEDAGEIWIRDPARRKGRQSPRSLDVVAAFSADEAKGANLNFIDRVARTPYDDQPFRTGFDDARRRHKAAEFAGAPENPRAGHNLSLAFASCPYPELKDFIRRDLLPAFFGAYPAGRILFVALDYVFESRYAALRGGYAATQLGDLGAAGLSANKFDALAAWQPLNTLSQPRNVLDLGCFAFFPTVQWITLSKPGLFALLVPGARIQHSPPPFPGGWMDFPRSHWDFGRERLASEEGLIGVSGIAASYAALRRFIHDPGWGAHEIEVFVRWLIERYNLLAFHQTDATEFVVSDPPGSSRRVVDFVTCFEQALTTDRVLRKALSCIASEETATRKAAAMEIADIIEAQRAYWTDTPSNAEWFKTLFHPQNGRAVLTGVLGTAPPPFGRYLCEVAAGIYQHLLDTVVDSIYVRSKVTGSGGILVKNRAGTSEDEETPAEFTANVIRALRNAHHGYLSVLDKSRRPSRYLALVSGETPETLSYLGVLFALALLAGPEAIIGCQLIPVGCYD